MRVLFVASPGIGHIFPVVSTAWALRAAGHEVLVATSGRTELTARAGLPVVDTAPGVDFGALFGGFAAEHGTPPRSRDGQAELAHVAALFGLVSQAFVAGTVALALAWRPDLVVHTLLQGAGPVAAAAVGAPAVVHAIGPAQRAEQFAPLLARELAPEYERLGLAPPPVAATLDVSPPSLRAPGSTGWSMRYVPYNGGAVLPDWLRVPRERRRVTVTLGSVLPLMAGVGSLRPFVAAAGAVDAEFVLALGGADTSALGELPDNVRAVGWVPLGALLAASDAVVHHGGAGTLLTALNAGLPQLVLPQGADQFANAVTATNAGAALTVTPAELDEPRLTALLTDPARRAAAESIAAEMAGQPTPADLVPQLATLTA